MITLFYAITAVDMMIRFSLHNVFALYSKLDAATELLHNRI